MEIAEFSDEAGSFITQSDEFSFKDANINWKIVVAIPVDRVEYESAVKGTGLFIAVLSISLFGFFACAIMFGLFYALRNEKIVENADWRFTCAFLFGSGLLNLANMTHLGYVSASQCELRQWAINLSFHISKYRFHGP